MNPAELLLPAAFEALNESLPDVSQFEKSFDAPRRAGQMPHNRYKLEYDKKLSVPAHWGRFIAELRSARYRRAMSRLLGVRSLEFRMHWHYAPRGSSVSPHCDGERKLGSHIFYFHGEGDWDQAWGGETLVLDDGGKFSPDSAPDFDEFVGAVKAESSGNRSFIFSRNGNSWHGVRPLQCPEDRMRKVFIVVLNQSSLRRRIKDTIKRKQITRL
jgi:hypothetical protein